MKDNTKAEHLRKLLAKYAMRSGEEFKRGMPSVVREAHESKCWQDCFKSDGSKFTSLAEWLTAPPPPGCGLGCTTDAITYDELLAACEDEGSGFQDVAKILAAERPKGKPGRKSKEHHRKIAAKIQTARSELNGDTHTRRPNLAARLQKEKPQFYQGFLDGKYGSLRAAAEAAKMVKPGHDALMRLKAYWRKATKKQRTEFMKFVQEQNQ